MSTLLLVDDHALFRAALTSVLEHLAPDLNVAHAPDLQAAFQHCQDMGPPDLVLLDLGLPDGDGATVLAQLRQQHRWPVLVISARHDEGQKIGLLDAGADDYLVKPFSAGELLARMRVALRHRGRTVEAALTLYQRAGVAVDLKRHTVTRDGQPVHLTPTEFNLLARLVRSAGQVVTHRQLLVDVWGAEHAHDTHYLRLYMGQLRAKLEANPTEPQWLLTEAGVGYRLAEPDGG